MKSVTLGITTYGGAHLLKNCLESIKKSVFDAGYSNFEVIVVNDGTPATKCKLSVDELIPSAIADVTRWIQCNENKGNVARYNLIAKQSNGDIIYLIDNDVIIPDRWFWAAYSFFVNNEKVGVASFLSKKVSLEEATELLKMRRIPADGSGWVPERATELAGYCYGFTRENWESVDGFDEDNFKFFVGDSDFCCRLAKKGLMSYRMLYPQVYHIEHATYDAYKELDAWKRANQDLTNFKKKWRCTPKIMETKLLREVKPQIISWYANYSHHQNWDVKEKQPFDDVRPTIIPSQPEE